MWKWKENGIIKESSRGEGGEVTRSKKKGKEIGKLREIG